MNRDNTIDIIKGVAILSVIVGHLTHFWALKSFIYTFHMPIFFFASGYFFKKKQSRELMKSLSKSLLLPYLLVAIILNIDDLIGGDKSWFAILFADGYINDTLMWGNQPIIGMLWFLPALFWCRIIYNRITEQKYSTLISIIVTVLSFFLGKYVINIPLGFFEGGQAVGLYMLGHQIRNKEDRVRKTSVISILAVLWIAHFFVGGFSMADFSAGIYPINMMGASAACILIPLFTKWYCSLSKFPRVNSFLSWCGMNSLFILIAHALFEGYTPHTYWPWQVLMHFIVCTVSAWLFTKIKLLIRK